MEVNRGARQLKKHKPKRKVSELDEDAAKRRRSQTRLAQRAFRKRKDEALYVLNEQISDLHNTIEELNNCFLTLTDVLTTSGQLQQDSRIAQSLKLSIEKFITTISESRTLDEDRGSLRTRKTIQEIGDSAPSGDSDNAFSMSLSSPVGSVRKALTRPSIASGLDPADSLDSGSELPLLSDEWLASLAGEDYTRSLLSSDAPMLPSSPQVPLNEPRSLFSLEVSPLHLLDIPSLPFARRLQLAAWQAAFRLVYTAEKQLQLYHQVFNFVLNFHTQESLKSLVTRILNENFNRLLDPPPESLPGAVGMGWLNASEVESYFRGKGLDCNKSPIVAGMEMDADYFGGAMIGMSESLDMQTATSSVTHRHFSPNSYIPPETENNLASTTANFSNTFPSQTARTVYVDVSKLINELVLQPRCFGRNPMFDRSDLDNALWKAVI
ncbi:hypothetical protein NA57DRAFT_62298 [Rhizodiscina lignyota]|uniref:BZIP domain-containing protein n=1 Tax=Rhizodiscina lignyota TaxID=1504668 RepID=A0A9P4I0A7_9PEZI|nr:hypothetical protein NA57DRAFT_62298 [Rhizodiscina lignyota]